MGAGGCLKVVFVTHHHLPVDTLLLPVSVDLRRITFYKLRLEINDIMELANYEKVENTSNMYEYLCEMIKQAGNL